MTYPQQPWQQPAQKPISTRGAKVLTFSGVAVAIVGIAALIFAGFSFASVLPTDIIRGDGRPGDAIIASSEVPGQTTFELTEGSLYTLWTVKEGTGLLDVERSDVEIRDSNGEVVYLTSPSVTGNNTRQSFHAKTLASFKAPTSGTYTLDAAGDRSGKSDTQLFLSGAQDIDSFIWGVFSSIGLTFVGLGGLFLGGAMALGGGIWWAVAKSNRKRQQTMAQGPGYPGPGPAYQQGRPY